MKIKILITGGTIDKVYNDLTGELVFKNTHIVDMLNRARSMTDSISEVLFLKDSLAITKEDRQLILSKCLEANENKIVITHGTDTMVETAQLLGRKVKNKTVILFGAMIPYSVNHSDALFNLGFALSSVQTLSKGVYIAMNGRIFEFDKVIKNKIIGVFE
ncbi:MAG: asparaginase [Gammaproteobacteria bacterium]|uniref:L-asparaginase n=1 Tax=endosymbiont of Bathymodiolus septemdierum str. Myojin knoll TaxID=1303921 RepID=A0A0P0URH1_9GAMM|nr:asparaginase domain-containing protein [Bathymodiolus septemdierum thioautotrophic gill symbiont]RUA05951.1 MAG: asparaginase [Gammaproteobacteria bacterium]BAS67372.1 L-asparaginase [endosymbiont of Bathymodiolus septemdierum str. Myojin knoll]